MAGRFDEVISDQARLREIIGHAGALVANKAIDHIDDICRRFIAASPYVIMGTMGGDGLIDLSPKGDPAGFVRVLDEKTLAIPDRLGNRRIDTFENLLRNPAVGLFFMIPGYTVTLRVNGKARLVRDAKLQAELAVDGKLPKLVTIVTVDEAFSHCAKSMARANIWRPEAWPDTSNVPTLAEAMVAHAKLLEHAQMQAIIDNDFKTRMY
ncbi:MAG: MSMEG_1061 family FMN-dependent PPOX-type flavoprotein [Lysobacterales bacterium]